MPSAFKELIHLFLSFVHPHLEFNSIDTSFSKKRDVALSYHCFVALPAIPLSCYYIKRMNSSPFIFSSSPFGTQLYWFIPQWKRVCCSLSSQLSCIFTILSSCHQPSKNQFISTFLSFNRQPHFEFNWIDSSLSEKRGCWSFLSQLSCIPCHPLITPSSFKELINLHLSLVDPHLEFNSIDSSLTKKGMLPFIVTAEVAFPAFK